MLATTVDRALVRLATAATGGVSGEFVIAKEGDEVTTADGTFNLTGFGNVGTQVDDAGNVLWFGAWDDDDTLRNSGIFLNDLLLVQEDVTQIDGLTVVTLRNVPDTLVMSDNGAYVLFEAELDDPTSTNNLEGAFLIAILEPATAVVLAGVGALALCRRRR